MFLQNYGNFIIPRADAAHRLRAAGLTMSPLPVSPQALLAIGRGRARLLREAVLELCASGGHLVDAEALDWALAQFLARRPGLRVIAAIGRHRK